MPDPVGDDEETRTVNCHTGHLLAIHVRMSGTHCCVGHEASADNNCCPKFAK